MIELVDTPRGVVVSVQASPGSRRNCVIGEYAGRLKVAVTAAPERGKANSAIVEVLAEFFEIKRSQIELIAGETNPQKKFLLHNTTRDTVSLRIQQRLLEKTE